MFILLNNHFPQSHRLKHRLEAQGLEDVGKRVKVLSSSLSSVDISHHTQFPANPEFETNFSDLRASCHKLHIRFKLLNIPDDKRNVMHAVLVSRSEVLVAA